MTGQQMVAMWVPLLLVATMVPAFRLLARRYGRSLAWYLGLAIFWLVWGLAYPLALIGRDGLLALLRPPAFEWRHLLVALIPILFAASGRLFKSLRYEKAARWTIYALLAVALGNGLFEEVVWRGTYLALFADSVWLQMVWPSLWFAAWHYAPGPVSSHGRPWVLMAGTLFLGLCLSYVARQSGTIFWCVVARTLASIITVA